MTDYLNLVEVLAIHDDQMERYGGAQGVRDFGLIEAALFRPQTGYYEDLLEEAAALWESLSQNHPFVDGNKRSSFAATDVFLRMNGWSILANPLEAYEDIMRMYEGGRFCFGELKSWLKVRTRPSS